MDAKERLRNFQNLKREYTQLRQQLEETETMLYYPKIQRLTGMPGGGRKDGTSQENLIIRHIELQEQYWAKLDELAAEQLAIEETIEALESNQRVLLRYRYIDGLKWKEICDRMNYSWTQIHRIHADTLASLEASHAAKCG